VRLDDWLPLDSTLVRERHVTHIAAPPAIVQRALWQTDFGGPLSRALLLVRLVPVMLSDPSLARARLARHRRDPRLTLQSILDAMFVRLEELPAEELVLGLTGRFWTPSGGVLPTDPATFRAGPPAGHAQAGWNFVFAKTPDGGTALSTETRVRVAAGPARTRFRAYWLLVRPFSGLLRRAMLRAVKREAERLRDAAST
jgi:hypothetical protein